MRLNLGTWAGYLRLEEAWSAPVKDHPPVLIALERMLDEALDQADLLGLHYSQRGLARLNNSGKQMDVLCAVKLLSTTKNKPSAGTIALDGSILYTWFRTDQHIRIYDLASPENSLEQIVEIVLQEVEKLTS